MSYLIRTHNAVDIILPISSYSRFYFFGSYCVRVPCYYKVYNIITICQGSKAQFKNYNLILHLNHKLIQIRQFLDKQQHQHQ
jgi:hypothetical protein